MGGEEGSCISLASRHIHNRRTHTACDTLQSHLSVSMVGRHARAHQAKGRGQRLLRHRDKGVGALSRQALQLQAAECATVAGTSQQTVNIMHQNARGIKMALIVLSRAAPHHDVHPRSLPKLLQQL